DVGVGDCTRAMALLDTVNWHWFGKALEREILDEHRLDFGRCDGKPSTSCEVDFVGRRYRLHAGGERKRLTDEVAILNGGIAEPHSNATGQPIVASAELRKSQRPFHRDRRLGPAIGTGKSQPIAVARALHDPAVMLGCVAR